MSVKVYDQVYGFNTRSMGYYHLKLSDFRIDLPRKIATMNLTDRGGKYVYNVVRLKPYISKVTKEHCYVTFFDLDEKFIAFLYNTTEGKLISRPENMLKFELVTNYI